MWRSAWGDGAVARHLTSRRTQQVGLPMHTVLSVHHAAHPAMLRPLPHEFLHFAIQDTGQKSWYCDGGSDIDASIPFRKLHRLLKAVHFNAPPRSTLTAQRRLRASCRPLLARLRGAGTVPGDGMPAIRTSWRTACCASGRSAGQLLKNAGALRVRRTASEDPLGPSLDPPRAL